MNSYVGKICPFCKTEFKENDDIVVCSTCDMPHHKECWIENQGCTTFGCLGTIKAADNSANTVTATEISFDDNQPVVAATTSNVFCTKCGAANSNDSSFCSKCGAPLVTNRTTGYQPPNQPQTNYYQQQGYGYAQQTQIPPQNNTYYNNTAYQQSTYSNNADIDSDVVALIGTKQEYYIPKFREMKSQNKKNTWNWVAFFFLPYWFMYRKMYGYGFASLGVAFFITLLNTPILSLLSLGGYITMGIFANYIYMQWLEKQAAQAKTMNEPFRSQHIMKNGGVSSTALILTIVGYAVIIGIFNAM